MLYFSRLKIISIIVFCLSLIFFSISNFINNEVFFLKKKVNLGLDLLGGSYLLLEVDKNPVKTYAEMELEQKEMRKETDKILKKYFGNKY